MFKNDILETLCTGYKTKQMELEKQKIYKNQQCTAISFTHSSSHQTPNFAKNTKLTTWLSCLVRKFHWVNPFQPNV